jgi:Fur family transcriptional regulator, ferric uptake regulator
MTNRSSTLSAALDPLASANTLLAELPGRRTRGRAHVLASLIESRRALTHSEIEQTLPPDVVLDRVTLYRILEWLVEQNVVHRVAGADRAVRFAYSGGSDPTVISSADMHAHFQCDQCASVVCLDSVPTQLPSLVGGYIARNVDVLVHGLCNHCAKKQPTLLRSVPSEPDPR